MKAMKKLLSLFAAVVTVMFSSCSNDDIPMAPKVTFKVDPSTVVSSFYELYSGDLTSLDESEAKLRIRLYVYNNSGNLVASDYAFSQDYLHVKNFNFSLPEGTYTTVAVTDVVLQDGTEMYNLKGEDELSTFTLTCVNSFTEKSILGITIGQQHIGSSNDVFIINVQPAGALITCQVANWNDCTNYTDSDGDVLDIVRYRCLSKSIQGQITVNNSENLILSNEVETPGKFFTWALWDRNKQYSGGYGYTFKFPEKNVYVLWRGLTSKGTIIDFVEGYVDLELGKHYLLYFDMSDLSCEWSEYNKSMNAPAMMENAQESCATMKNNPLNISGQDSRMFTNEGKAIKAIDYLK